jgi:TfoX/Sxy family transcriptional regulator of competence genes
MVHDPKHLRTIFQRATPPDLEVKYKPMFGGILAYIFDKPCGSLSDIGLAVRLPGAGRAELLAIPGAEPLRYAPHQPFSKTYVVVPDTMLDDPTALRGSIARSAAEVQVKGNA